MKKVNKINKSKKNQMKKSFEKINNIMEEYNNRISYIYEYLYFVLSGGKKLKGSEAWYFDIIYDYNSYLDECESIVAGYQYVYRDVLICDFSYEGDVLYKKLPIYVYGFIDETEYYNNGFEYVDSEGETWRLYKGEFPDSWLHEDFEEDLKKQFEDYYNKYKEIEKKKKDKEKEEKEKANKLKNKKKKAVKSARSKLKKMDLTDEEIDALAECVMEKKNG